MLNSLKQWRGDLKVKTISEHLKSDKMHLLLMSSWYVKTNERKSINSRKYFTMQLFQSFMMLILPSMQNKWKRVQNNNSKACVLWLLHFLTTFLLFWCNDCRKGSHLWKPWKIWVLNLFWLLCFSLKTTNKLSISCITYPFNSCPLSE